MWVLSQAHHTLMVAYCSKCLRRRHPPKIPKTTTETPNDDEKEPNITPTAADIIHNNKHNNKFHIFTFCDKEFHIHYFGTKNSKEVPPQKLVDAGGERVARRPSWLDGQVTYEMHPTTTTKKE
jgi:hypothetical protein